MWPHAVGCGSAPSQQQGLANALEIEIVRSGRRAQSPEHSTSATAASIVTRCFQSFQP